MNFKNFWGTLLLKSLRKFKLFKIISIVSNYKFTGFHKLKKKKIGLKNSKKVL